MTHYTFHSKRSVRISRKIITLYILNFRTILSIYFWFLHNTSPKYLPVAFRHALCQPQCAICTGKDRLINPDDFSASYFFHAFFYEIRKTYHLAFSTCKQHIISQLLLKLWVIIRYKLGNSFDYTWYNTTASFAQLDRLS